MFERKRGESGSGRAAGVWLVGGVLLWALLLSGCSSSGGSRTLGSNEQIPGDLENIPDAVPRVEPRARYGNPATYVVFGKRYYTKTSSQGHVERGLASWYGPNFHGRNTSSGERYDMYQMTAAHKSLPLPTYARVTNLENGRSAVVKINDRGPFHGPRVIDLSYAAATKLGVVKKGTAMVEVRAIDPSRPDSDKGPFLADKPAAKSAPTRRTVARTDPPKPRREIPEPVAATPVKRAAEPLVVAAAQPQAEPRPVVAASEPAPKPAVAAPAPETPSVEARDSHRRAVDTAVAAVAKGPSPASSIYLQVGAFGNPVNAERLRERLVGRLADQVLVHKAGDSGTSLYKVRVGPLASEGDAARVSRQIVALGVNQPRRVLN